MNITGIQGVYMYINRLTNSKNDEFGAVLEGGSDLVIYLDDVGPFDGSTRCPTLLPKSPSLAVINDFK
jgi:hypothetical protein